MKTTTLWVCVLMAATATAAADVGDLEPVRVDLPDLPRGFSWYSWQMTKPGGAKTGLVSPKAIVATLRRSDELGPNGRFFKAALDGEKADAAAPSVLRLDFSGKGDFGKAALLRLGPPIKKDQYTRHAIEPAWVDAPLGPDGKTVPVLVSGAYMRSNWRHLSVNMMRVSAGRCAFGKTVLPVRVIDGNGNLVLGDRRAAPQWMQGDLLAIDAGRNGFKGGSMVVDLGQPVLIEGQWFHPKVSEDGARIEAEAVEHKTAHVKTAEGFDWTCILVGADGAVRLSQDVTAAPAGKYQLSGVDLTRTADGKTVHLQMAAPWSRQGPRLPEAIEIAEGQTLSLPVLPLKARVKAEPERRDPRSIELSLELTSESQLRVYSITINDDAPPPPKVRIRDAAGTLVYEETLEYG